MTTWHRCYLTRKYDLNIRERSIAVVKEKRTIKMDWIQSMKKQTDKNCILERHTETRHLHEWAYLSRISSDKNEAIEIQNRITTGEPSYFLLTIMQFTTEDQTADIQNTYRIYSSESCTLTNESAEMLNTSDMKR